MYHSDQNTDRQSATLPHPQQPELITSVATLLLGKILDSMIKNTRFAKKTLDNKSKLTHSENAQKMHCNANHGHCATHCKPETKKTGDRSNACVCL